MDNMPATLKYIFTKSHPQAQSTTSLTSYETHKSRTAIKKGRNVPVDVDQKRRRWGERGGERPKRQQERGPVMERREMSWHYPSR